MIHSGTRLGDWIVERQQGRGVWGQRLWVRNSLISERVGVMEVALAEESRAAVHLELAALGENAAERLVGAGEHDGHVYLVYAPQWAAHDAPAAQDLQDAPAIGAPTPAPQETQQDPDIQVPVLAQDGEQRVDPAVQEASVNRHEGTPDPFESKEVGEVADVSAEPQVAPEGLGRAALLDQGTQESLAEELASTASPADGEQGDGPEFSDVDECGDEPAADGADEVSDEPVALADPSGEAEPAATGDAGDEGEPAGPEELTASGFADRTDTPSDDPSTDADEELLAAVRQLEMNALLVSAAGNSRDAPNADVAPEVSEDPMSATEELFDRFVADGAAVEALHTEEEDKPGKGAPVWLWPVAGGAAALAAVAVALSLFMAPGQRAPVEKKHHELADVVNAAHAQPTQEASGTRAGGPTSPSLRGPSSGADPSLIGADGLVDDIDGLRDRNLAGRDLSLSDPDARLGGAGVGSASATEVGGLPSPGVRQVRVSPEARAAVSKVLKARVPRLRTCYENSLRAQPGLQGQWRLRMTVSKDGHGSRVSLRGLNMSNGDMEACMVERLATWRFGEIGETVPVEEVLTFRL